MRLAESWPTIKLGRGLSGRGLDLDRRFLGFLPILIFMMLCL